MLLLIQKNLDGEMSLNELARAAHFSPYHFHRIFRGMVGESLKEHIRRLRLERAAMRLKHTDRSVLDIALEAGYETHEAFSRAFRSLRGCSPSRFRADNSLVYRADAPGVHYRENGSIEEFKLKAGGSTMDVRIERLEPMRVAFVRHIGPYNQASEAWEKLCTRLGSEGLLGGDVRFVGVCYDDPEVTTPENVRYDACVTVDEDFEGQADLGVQTIGGGEYAVVTHFGPYEGLGRTYAELYGRWMPQHGRQPRSEPCLEFYLNDPEGADPEDLLTDIYAPLEPVA